MAIVLDRNFAGTVGNAYNNSDDADFDNVVAGAIYGTTNYVPVKSLAFPVGAQAVVGETFTGTTVRTFSRIWNVNQNPSANGEVFQVRSSGSRGPGILINTNGKIYVTQVNGTATWLSTNSIPLNTDFRVTITINGTAITFTWYPDDTSTTPVETMGPFTLSSSVTMVTARDGHLTSTGLGAGAQLKMSWPKDSDNTTDPGPRTYAFTYNVSLADNLGITDTGSPQLTSIELLIADALGISDSLVKDIGLAKGAADTAGITDSLTASLSRVVSVSDSETAIDDSTYNFAVITSISDAGSQADDVSIVWSKVTALNDSETATESLGSIADKVLGIADSETETDAVIYAWSKITTVADTETGTDALSVVISYVRPLADTGTGTDALSVTWDRVISVNDVEVSIENLTTNALGSTIISDSGTEVDSLSILWSTPTFADTGTGNDDLSVNYGVSNALSDAGVETDSISVVWDRLVTVVDVETGVDTLTYTRTLDINVADTSTNVDSVGFNTGSQFFIGDSQSATETVNFQLSTFGIQSDAGTSTEQVTTLLTRPYDFGDAELAVDSLTFAFTRVFNFQETGTQIDNVHEVRPDVGNYMWSVMLNGEETICTLVGAIHNGELVPIFTIET